MKEFLLKPVENRFTLLPIRFKNFYDYFKQHETGFWTTEEIDLRQDVIDWETKLSDNERYFIENILAFFAGSDGIVNENLVVNFYESIEIPEVRAFYSMQILMESIHCVSGETKILTKNGFYQIKDLLNKYVDIWNGYEFSKVIPLKTGSDCQVYKIKLNNGLELDCTSKHKWYLEDNSMKYTEELSKGDTLLNNNSYPVLDIFENPDNFYDNLDYSTFFSKNIKSIFVPVNYTIDIKLKWLNGFLSYFENYEDNNCLVIKDKCNFNKNMWSNVIYLLQTLGCYCFYDTKNRVWKLPFTEIYKLNHLGLNYLKYTSKPGITEKECLKIEEVSLLSSKTDTYCFNEPKNHTGIFNGILTGQSETYSVLIDTLIKDAEKRNNLFGAINNIPAVSKKANWALKWINTEKIDTENIISEFKKLPTKENAYDLFNKLVLLKEDQEYTNLIFVKRLLAFIIVEGLFFSGSFCAIFWLKNRGLMPGLSFSNELISRDEAIHCSFGIELYKYIDNKLPEEQVHSLIKEAVDIEEEFVTESLPVSLIGMNSDSMKDYIKFVADRILLELGYSKIWNIKECPFKFMELISFSGGNSKVNFFEKRNADYNKAGVGKTEKESSLTFDEDF